MTVGDVIGYATDMPQEIEDLLLQAIDTNLKISQESLNNPYGLSVGKTLMKDFHYPPENYLEALNVGAALAAGGSDARMAGCQLPVVINSGSGNQGITLTVPLAVVAGYLKKTPKETAQALCIAELIGLVLTAIKGRLSAQCGAFTAATGMGCGLAWMQGGDEAVLERVIKNMVGDLAGVICDGAKMTCALKIYSCVQSAYLASKLALDGLAPTPECGIIGEDAKKTLGNLSQLTHADQAQKLNEKIQNNERLRKELNDVRKGAREAARKVSVNIPKLKDCKYHLGQSTAHGMFGYCTDFRFQITEFHDDYLAVFGFHSQCPHHRRIVTSDMNVFELLKPNFVKANPAIKARRTVVDVATQL